MRIMKYLPQCSDYICCDVILDIGWDITEDPDFRERNFFFGNPPNEIFIFWAKLTEETIFFGDCPNDFFLFCTMPPPDD